MDPYDIVTSSLSTTIGLTWRGSKQSKKKSIDMKRWIVMHGHAEIAANVPNASKNLNVKIALAALSALISLLRHEVARYAGAAA